MITHLQVRPRLCAGISLLAALITAAPSLAQTAPAPLLVDVEWLQQHLNDPDLVLLHVGGAADYDRGHIAGAHRIAEQDLSRPHDMTKMAEGDLMLELPPIDQLRQTMAARGISDTSRIVVYSGQGSAVPSSTRVIFTLDYLGLGDRTSLLNGGLAAWSRAGRPTTTAAPSPRHGVLSERQPRPVVASGEEVQSLATRPRHRLIDARAAVYYKGIEAGMTGEKGHIPGAINIPFSTIADDNQVIDPQHVAALFQAAGIQPGDTLVAYCHVGQQATAVVFAARLLGHPAQLYDGSFQDWTTRVHGPVER